jgi:hypothetical protein
LRSPLPAKDDVVVVLIGSSLFDHPAKAPLFIHPGSLFVLAAKSQVGKENDAAQENDAAREGTMTKFVPTGWLVE